MVFGWAATAAHPLLTRRRGRLKNRLVLPITWAMSIETTLARVDAIRQALADPSLLVGSRTGSTGGTEAPASSTSGAPFAAALAQASAGYSAGGRTAAALESPPQL